MNDSDSDGSFLWFQTEFLKTDPGLTEREKFLLHTPKSNLIWLGFD